MKPTAQDAGYWKGRAEKCREIADGMENAFGKRVLLDLADTYEEMASAATRRSPAQGLRVTVSKRDSLSSRRASPSPVLRAHRK
jgi:hypothetical protein